MKKRWGILVALCLLICLTLTGCGEKVKNVLENDPILGGEGMNGIDTDNFKSDDDEQYTDDGQQIISAENTEAVVYLIIPSSESSTGEEKTIIEEAAAESDYNLIVRNYGCESSIQSQCFDEAIDVRASLIICDNWDDELTQEDCDRASDAGIPVILLNRGISVLGKASYQVVTNYNDCLNTIAEKFMESQDGASNYIALYDSDNDMQTTFEMNLTGYKDTVNLGVDKCSGSDSTESYNCAWNLMKNYPEADTIICGTATQAIQALSAMKDLNLGMSVFCLYGDSDKLENYINSGSITAAAVKPAGDIAAKAIDIINDYISNGELPQSELNYIQASIKEYVPESITAEPIETEEDESEYSEEDESYSEDSYDEEEYYDDYYDEDYDDYDRHYDDYYDEEY